MGQQHDQEQKFNDNHEFDYNSITEILQEEKGCSNINERFIQAVRISENCRVGVDQIQAMTTNNIDSNDNLYRVSTKVQVQRKQDKKYLMQGILLKSSPSLFNQWNERYCYLTQTTFIYNENNKINSIRAGLINFNLLCCDIIINQNKNNVIQYFCIKVISGNKQFVFTASKKNQNGKWIKQIKNVIDKSVGKLYNLTYLAHYHRFWRKDYFSEKQFREQSQTGDLILMRGKAESAAMQRAITHQQYDHIALVVKNIKEQVLLFEANGVIGVGIMPWNRFIAKNYYKKQEIKLHIERKKEFYEEIEEFIQHNMGRKYKFSVKKYLLHRNSDIEHENKSYFCSSLVAKIYKILGLLHQKKSCTQYMPHNFAEKQHLQLKQNGKYGNAFLGNQQIIVFEKQFFEIF